MTTNSSSLFSFGLGCGTLCPRLLHWSATALTLKYLYDLCKTLRRRRVRPVQSQSPCFYLGPDASLHLHHTKKAGLAAFLQGRCRLRQRLVRIEVENWNPARTLPLFNSKKAMRHNSKFLSVKVQFHGAHSTASTQAIRPATRSTCNQIAKAGFAGARSVRHSVSLVSANSSDRRRCSPSAGQDRSG